MKLLICRKYIPQKILHIIFFLSNFGPSDIFVSHLYPFLQIPITSSFMSYTLPLFSSGTYR